MTLELVRTETDRVSSGPLPTRRSRRLAQSQGIPVVPAPTPALAATTDSVPPAATEPVLETRASRRRLRETGAVPQVVGATPTGAGRMVGAAKPDAPRPTAAAPRSPTSAAPSARTAEPVRRARATAAPAAVPAPAAPHEAVPPTAAPEIVTPTAVAPVAVAPTGTALEAAGPETAPSSSVVPEARAPQSATPEAAAPEAAAPDAAMTTTSLAASVDADRDDADHDGAEQDVVVPLRSRSSGRVTAAPHRAWIPRTAVVAALAVTTIALPTTGALSAIKGSPVKDLVAPGNVTAEAAQGTAAAADAIGPSTLAILTSATEAPTSPKILAQSVSSRERLAAAASRSEPRSSLTSCAGGTVQGSNGMLDESKLCELPQGGFLLQPDAALAFSEMSDAFEARFGRPMRVSSAYRSYGEQLSVRSVKGGMAATPGKSNHGWGYAIDFSSSTYSSSAEWQWLQANANSFGWFNPDWAKSSKYEPWHWEYRSGVESVGGYGYE